MQLKKQELDKVYRKLRIDFRNTKHRIGWLIHEGRKILMLSRSHGKGDVHIADRIRSQVHLSVDQFSDLVKCPLAREGYIEILKDKGIID